MFLDFTNEMKQMKDCILSNCRPGRVAACISTALTGRLDHETVPIIICGLEGVKEIFVNFCVL